ncbi:hypothetical protein [Streptomyces cylindrosporus]|uniref:Conjugal transfer protein TraB n=1 Tax=Streptomyces cylindrosporus TaxID=2927583 RepID=A0ABS9YGF8_9ACTN|nr:hypothetical protein [Streptomyces cylindrosporus]MCI3276279.1 hypothetical protein [Streptomyces cylindrosporus]
MSELVPRPRGVLATTTEYIGEAVRYTVLLTQLAAAGVALGLLSEAVRSAYRYVEGCAASVDRLADKAASLHVDGDVVAAHYDAASVMRSVLEEADAMAEAASDLSVMFQQTADAHRADYGPVADAMNSKDGQVADREYYSNR